MQVLWLRPSKPDNISVGRERIAEALSARGISVVLQDSTGTDALSATRTALSGDFDVIVGTVRMGLYLGYLLSRIQRKPLLADVTDPIAQISDLPNAFFRLLVWYEWHILSRAEACTFAYSSSYAEAGRRNIDGIKVENGVDYDRFHDPDSVAVSDSKQILEDVGVPLERNTAIYVGGFTEVYNIDVILETAASLDDWNFVFIGDGAKRPDIERMAADEPNVFYPGSFEYHLIPGFLKHADIGLCLVDAEQPLKILEYGAAGLPVVAANGELRNRFNDDEILFIDPSSSQLAEALQSVSRNDSVAEEYSAKLRERAKDCRWEDIADKYESILRAIQ